MYHVRQSWSQLVEVSLEVQRTIHRSFGSTLFCVRETLQYRIWITVSSYRELNMGKLILELLLTLLASSRYTFTQALQPPGAYAPLVEDCGPVEGIVCVNKYVRY